MTEGQILAAAAISAPTLMQAPDTQFVAQALNGPAFDGVPGTNEPGAQTRFNYRSDDETLAACAEAMAQTVETAGN